MKNFGGYSIATAQIDDEIKNLNVRICPFSTISLLVRRSDVRCFSTAGMKNQRDAILESFGTTEEIIISIDFT